MATRNARDYMQTEHPELFSHIYAKISTDNTVNLVTAGQNYPVAGAWSAIHASNFTLGESNGIITLIGPDALFFYGPSLIMQVNKVCKITLSTYVNGLLETDTTIDVKATQLNGDIIAGRMSLINLATNDTLQILIKSDQPSTNVTFTHNRLLLK